MKKIFIDARMINSSGIGTVLQNLIPFFLNDFEVTLLGDKNAINGYKWLGKYNLIHVNAPIYSIYEQIEIPLKIQPCHLFLSPHYNIPLLPIKADKRITIIHDVNHLVFKNQLNLIQRIYSELFLNAAVNKSDKIITISEFSKKEIQKYISCADCGIEVMYCAVDKSKILPSLTKDDLNDFVLDRSLPAEYLLYMGSERHHKNFRNLIKALHILLTEKDYKLVVVGNEQSYRNSFTELNDFPKENLFFTGYISNSELAKTYQAAKCLVFPSYYEGFGLPPLEAMANGCPVISSNAASLPEVCSDAALYFNPDDTKEIAEKIGQLVDDPGLQDRLREKGYRNVKRFSWETSYAKIKNVITGLIGAVD